MFDPKYYSSITNYDEEKVLTELWIENFIDGYTEMLVEYNIEVTKEKKEEMLLSALSRLVQKGRITIDYAAQRAQITVQEFKEKTELKK